MVEVVIAVVIAAAAGHVLYHNLKKKASGDCGCGSCSTKHK